MNDYYVITIMQTRRQLKVSTGKNHFEIKTLIDRSETIINICHNFVPQKHETLSDKDPLCLNDHLRLLIKKKNAIFQKYLKDGRTNMLTTLTCIRLLQNQQMQQIFQRQIFQTSW